jgi:hypothetical protein
LAEMEMEMEMKILSGVIMIPPKILKQNRK